VREVVIDGELQVSTDGVKAVVTLSRPVHIENRPALEVPVAKQLEDGGEVDAAAAHVVIDAGDFVLFLRWC
jgi:hypothetical protein